MVFYKDADQLEKESLSEQDELENDDFKVAEELIIYLLDALNKYAIRSVTQKKEPIHVTDVSLNDFENAQNQVWLGTHLKKYVNKEDFYFKKITLPNDSVILGYILYEKKSTDYKIRAFEIAPSENQHAPLFENLQLNLIAIPLLEAKKDFNFISANLIMDALNGRTLEQEQYVDLESLT
ncbi:hypothetical protein J5Y03_07695 [Bacillus sp. RG28]|uniref:Uncharacterized protein n=1 Tax=Gottfriedia endophytica TaxID=2820819 RepID=A0A940SJN0_9BACI|nr:hypothetical protein [Gottfriedia endophytica]MBP0725074.1 hypothetical protein [Gottfriedia endophytica]